MILFFFNLDINILGSPETTLFLIISGSKSLFNQIFLCYIPYSHCISSTDYYLILLNQY